MVIFMVRYLWNTCIGPVVIYSLIPVVTYPWHVRIHVSHHNCITVTAFIQTGQLITIAIFTRAVFARSN
ncbi:hypothetical protein RSOLAG1IB_02901 [Rhizoctonia solani AG-1 IB]|uniref:Uncharacterized protein n=1 Tax=Thanatephorus cucumeris (strain AG1-IB / isolate 7/3/14) TaxID=1108050 RepID=A0A0B7FJK9_THACB|nr:hypothetical protein RSOLAG1IB_02901 [Rhizoctonia solani AG-1 IB]